MNARNLVFLLVAAALLLAGGSVRAADGIGLFLKPTVGGAWVTLKTLEIEKTFIRPPDAEDGDEEPDFGDFTEDDARRPVGRKAYYEGSGLAVGATAGVRLFSLWLGVNYSWMPVNLRGYSKRYRYDPDRVRATGRAFVDEGSAEFQRIQLEVRYGLPIWRFELALQTRVGGIIVDEGPLLIGRAANGDNGLTGDFGAGISYAALGWLTLGITGWFGFYSFTGAYDGAYGTVGGLDGSVVLSF